ncbi:MAG: gluzincin family metallopeptidase, partial [Candidatus Krumholzibacteriia bacterium]
PPARGAWSFLLRPGDLFHPLAPGAPLAWRVELPGVDAATVAGNVVAVGAAYRTPRPVAALYLLGAPRPLPWRTAGETRLACLAPGGEAAPAASWDRLERLLARARGDWGPYPWPTLVVVPDPARGDRSRAYPGVIETGPPAEGTAGDAALLHELLHGWFGLGVAAPPRGDWSEGLCALLADHDLRAAAAPAEAARFRRGLLRRFTALAGTPADVPLRDYAPGDTATDVVGYGKGLFFFLELRRELGEAAFVAGLRRLESRHAGGRADWSDLFRCFPVDASGDLAAFFTARLDRPGGPRLSIADAAYDRTRREVRVTLRQRTPATGPGLDAPAAPWPLRVRLRLDGLSGAPLWIALDREEQTCRLPAATAPAAVTVDPFWETFRLLDAADPPRAPRRGGSGR